MNSRIGFCCKWVSPTGDKVAEELVNQKTTTITALSKMNKSQVMTRLMSLVGNNLASLQQLVKVVGSYPEERRLLRFTSDVLPAYTHEVAEHVYSDSAMQGLMEAGFQAVGNLARSLDVRVSFHPGQYCLINNNDPGIYQRAVEEFEMHVDMFRMMGYANGWHSHGAAINIHCGGKEGGVTGFIRGLQGLSQEARNLITVENDEFSFGLDDLEPLAEYCPIVTDIYHEWVFSGGSYLQANDPRIARYIVPSWRGLKPLGHFSQPRQDLMLNHDPAILPSFPALKARGLSSNAIRGHSEMCWNTAMNDWAITHLSWMDIEVEAKQKNLASEQLFNQLP